MAQLALEEGVSQLRAIQSRPQQARSGAKFLLHGTVEVREGFLKEANSESKRRHKQRKGHHGWTG